MRFVMVLAAVFMLTANARTGAASAPTPLTGTSVIALQTAQPEQPATPNARVDINVNRGGGHWWASPTWIAIGAIGVVLLVVIVALIARGGGTTVIRE